MKLRLLFSVFALLCLVSVKAQITSVGLIGSATPGGWNVDTNMVQNPDSANLWTLTIDLIAGEAKFRADDDWAVNWGDVTYPLGVGTLNGPNIPIPAAGTFDVTFNSNTGAYYFSVHSDIGIIGSAAPFGWNEDVNMFRDAVDTNQYTLDVELGVGDVKFRQNDDWAVNWGAVDFPSGTGVQDGPNIPIAVGGEYIITFNKSTGDYNFQIVSFSSVGLIGDATPGGWDTPTEMTSSGPKQWTATLDLVDGGVQFSGDNGSVIFGGSDFPDGIATVGGDTIPVPAGLYIVDFNTGTGQYHFLSVPIYDFVSIIGSAPPVGDWATDFDMEHNGPDPSDWKLRIVLNDGELKFRANHDWAVNWGWDGDTTLQGTALRDGPNFPITAGEYNIYFSSLYGYYGFIEIRVFSSMGLIGTATPFADWATDVAMDKDANDENVWKIPSVNMVDGEAKFRAEGAWTTNWGAVDFPNGTGTQDGPNIMVLAGTYGVTFNSSSGEYAFGDPLTSTHDLLDPGSVTVFPNPTKDILNIDVSAVDLRGDVTLTVYDFTGKQLFSDKQQSNPQMKLNVASLQDGYYTLNISDGKHIIGKKFVILK